MTLHPGFTRSNMSIVKLLSPTNLKVEMEKFFSSNCEYNPVFRYLTEDCERSGFSNVDHSLIGEAEQVLEIGTRHGISDVPSSTSLCTTISLRQAFEDYCEKLDLSGLVDVKVSESGMALVQVVKPGSSSDIQKVTVYVSPASVPDHMIPGLVAHEVGTHALRMINDDHQIWARGNRATFKLKPHYATEEGLATLNAIVESFKDSDRSSVLWNSALRYYAAVQATRLDFVSLFRHMEQYVPQRENRFRFCSRVKRGLTDTSQSGGCSLDQSYFIGAVDILRHLHETNFLALYSGMLDRRDVNRLRGVAKMDCLRLPPFLASADMVEGYVLSLRRIARINQLELPIFRIKALPLFCSTRNRVRARGRSCTVDRRPLGTARTRCLTLRT